MTLCVRTYNRALKITLAVCRFFFKCRTTDTTPLSGRGFIWPPFRVTAVSNIFLAVFGEENKVGVLSFFPPPPYFRKNPNFFFWRPLWVFFEQFVATFTIFFSSFCVNLCLFYPAILHYRVVFENWIRGHVLLFERRFCTFWKFLSPRREFFASLCANFWCHLVRMRKMVGSGRFFYLV